MSFDLTFPLVVLAAYGLCDLLICAAVVLAWRGGLYRRLTDADAVLGVRLLPAMGSATIVLTVVLPAFLLYEPPHAHDHPGPLLSSAPSSRCWFSAPGFAAAGGHGGRPARWCGAHSPCALDRAPGGDEVHVINVREPVVGVVGGWKQRIVAARCVASACDHEEFRQVLAHEAAHMDARDNLKLLMLLTMPDALAWLADRPRADGAVAGRDGARGGRAGERRRPAQARRPGLGADQGGAALRGGRRPAAQGGAPERPARAAPSSSACGACSRRPRALQRRFPGRRVLTCALLVPLLAVPLYASVHRLIEALVAFGR